MMTMMMIVMLTAVPVSRLVEALQLCGLTLSESTRQRVVSFFDFLSHVMSNEHIANVTCDKLSRSQVSFSHSLLLSALPAS